MELAYEATQQMASKTEGARCWASRHAYERAKERFRWKKKVLDRMLVKAFDEGIEPTQTKGVLKKYLRKRRLEYQMANNTRIYGENVYFFCDRKLITIFRLNNHLLKHLANCR